MEVHISKFFIRDYGCGSSADGTGGVSACDELACPELVKGVESDGASGAGSGAGSGSVGVSTCGELGDSIITVRVEVALPELFVATYSIVCCPAARRMARVCRCILV